MAEKRKRQRGCPANSAETRADRPLDLAEVVRAEVGKFAALDVAPHEFGGIELRRVARQALNGKPRALSRQVRGHVAAFMRRQAIPDQEETPTAKMILELVQEADERDVVVTARPRLEEEATAPEVPPERQAPEDDPGLATPSVFFTAGQRVVTQCRIAVSFRSFARLAGRCSVQSSAPKRRQTCPG